MLASVERKGSVFITSFVRRLRGSSQPVLVGASDSLEYVVKFANNPQGPNVLFNECAGNELYRAFCMPVPEWRPLTITEAFIDSHPEIWMVGSSGERIRPMPGECFGSRFLGSGGGRILEVLPGSYIKRIKNLTDFWLAWLLDACAGHTDNRQAIFEEADDRKLHAVFIDHGNMFGGPKSNKVPHFCAPMYLDRRFYPEVLHLQDWIWTRIQASVDYVELRNRIGRLPQNWQTTSARGRFGRCLDTLADHRRVRGIVDQIQSYLYLRDLREEASIQNKSWSVDAILDTSVREPRQRRTRIG